MFWPFLASHTVDGRNPAPPQKPWNNNFLNNINKKPMVSNGFNLVRRDFATIHDMETHTAARFIASLS